MALTLIGSLTSPFVRKLRLVCWDRVEMKFEAINYFQPEGEAYLKSVSPINKLPILIDGDLKVFDSRVIYNYLAKKHSWQELRIDQENYLTAIDAITDTCANMFLYKKGGMDLNGDNWYLDRQKERLPSILEYLRPLAKSLSADKPEDWNFVSMSLFSFYYWAEFRKLVDLSPYPEARAFLDAFKHKPGVKETTLPES
jgi:glutathione S-transferase